MCWIHDSAFSIHTVTASYMYDKYVYVGNEDYAIRIWNIQTQSLYRKLEGHRSIITGFAYSPRHDLLFSVGIDGYLIAWHGNSMVSKYTHLKAPENRFPAAIYSIYFHPDLEIIALGLDCEIATFELSENLLDALVDSSNKCPYTLRQIVKIHNDRVHYIIGGGRRLYTASFDRTVYSTTILDLSISKQLSKHQTAVSAMIYEEMSQQLIIGDNSGIIRSFSADGLSLGPLAEGLEGSIVSLFFDQSLKLLWFVLSGGTVNMIDMKHPDNFIVDHFNIFKDLPHAGSSSSFFERILGNGVNTRIAAIVNKKYIYTWKWSDLAYSYKISTPNRPAIKLFGFSFMDEDSNIGISNHSTISINNQRTKKPGRKTIDFGNSSRINSSIVNPGLNVFIGGAKAISCKPVSEFIYKIESISHTLSECSAISFNYTENIVIFGFKNGQIECSSLSSPSILFDCHTEDFPIMDIYSFSSNCISISTDMSIVLWNIHDKLESIKRRNRIHDNYIVCSAFSELHQQLMTCDEAGFCRMWDFTEDSIKEDLLLDHRPYGLISCASYSESCDVWIIATMDGMIRCFSARNILKAPTFNFSVLPCRVTALSSGPSNDILIAVDDKTIRLMNIRTSEEKGIYKGHTDIITQIFVPPFGKRWISLQWNGEVYFWIKKNLSEIKTGNVTNVTTANQSSRLPHLSKKAEAPRVQSSAEREKPLSFYEKERKNLLLKRREEEIQLRQKKKSHAWKMLEQITKKMERAMDLKEEKKRQEERAKSQIHKKKY
ncbi:hypothetical protein TRFO_24687 [Tritrichomonas foetus]|uniref:WD repeat protein n=1 Tax=Tritrichomonas foetus TaxID=1144522 RepID=A0A1J4KC59_9EUKA|nr:hypothetical protein TRFO_24687 [Tritrichomonas foetus]|eukprot:OHT07045.1 hypothetical protein TRFO_24687 [Tritrichomonas foetus]